jgi:succinyl-diaminopimelate desuccinylase
MHLDIRWTQQLPASEVKTRLEGIEQLELESWFNDPMLKTDAENRYIQILEESCQESGFDVETTRKNAASDMRHFSAAGIPAVVFGPEGYGPHEPTEHAVVGSMEDYISALERFVERL